MAGDLIDLDEWAGTAAGLRDLVAADPAHEAAASEATAGPWSELGRLDVPTKLFRLITDAICPHGRASRGRCGR